MVENVLVSCETMATKKSIKCPLGSGLRLAARAPVRETGVRPLCAPRDESTALAARQPRASIHPQALRRIGASRGAAHTYVRDDGARGGRAHVGSEQAARGLDGVGHL